jgi:hypothetical protein
MPKLRSGDGSCGTGKWFSGSPTAVASIRILPCFFLCGFFMRDFTSVCRSTKARDNLSSFVTSMRTDRDQSISCAPFYAGFLIRKNAHPNIPGVVQLI